MSNIKELARMRHTNPGVLTIAWDPDRVLAHMLMLPRTRPVHWCGPVKRDRVRRAVNDALANGWAIVETFE